MGNNQPTYTAPDDYYILKIVTAGYPGVGKTSLFWRYAIVTAGDPGVGKTSLFWRYADDVFVGDNANFIASELKCKMVEVDGQKIKLHMFDRANLSFKSLINQYYKGSHGLLAVFDLTNMQSFLGVRDLVRMDGRAFCGRDVVIALVGNKADLTDKRVVSNAAAVDLACLLGVPYIETSAKTGINVEKAFAEMVSEIKAQIDNGTLEPRKPQSRVSTRNEIREKQGWTCAVQ